MADVDIDSFTEHDKTDAQPDETIPFALGEVIEGGSTWEPKQETSEEKLSQPYSKKHRLIGCIENYLKRTGQTPEAFHSDDFEVRDGKLYYRDKSTKRRSKGKS